MRYPLSIILAVFEIPTYFSFFLLIAAFIAGNNTINRTLSGVATPTLKPCFPNLSPLRDNSAEQRIIAAASAHKKTGYERLRP